ncbi:MAG: MarC family protein, partial [Bacteroidetes bacterium]
MHDIMLFMGTVIMGFFAIMNPIANTPIFMGLTSSIDEVRTKNIIAFRSVLFAFVMVSVFVILGNFIFQVFGITLPAFQLTGGILLFLIGYDMLQGQTSKIRQHSKEDHEEIKAKAADSDTVLSLALTPLGIPILAGPGTIATAMNVAGMSSGMGHVEHAAAIIIAFALMCLVTFLMFISA